MTEAHNQLGRVTRLNADAVGEPGERRFRLIVESLEGRTAVLWMEKEQLFQLGAALKELSAEAEDTGVLGPSPSLEAGEDAAGPELEFQVGRLAVGYDPRIALFVIAAYDEEDPEDALPTVNLMATHEEVEALADEAFTVCAAGRPVCDLCGSPMEHDFHNCPALNGQSVLDL